ncbi:glycosyltransferase family 4 protein [Lacisediminihabitans sp.]|uniref:glycosyltransferase family 4 protein n=1 Tax=Lacisediminihabitans sp. TaxID=2787631 RepID=UPI00374DAE23
MAKELTGTERYAAEVTRELVAAGDMDVELRVPADAVLPDWAASAKVIRSRATGMFFEQIALPLTTLGTHLLNLSGPAPLIRRNQSVVLFDASVFRYPRTFSRGFVAWYTVLYRVLSRTARHVFTISEFSADEIAEVVRVPRSRLTVAPCGADHATRAIPERPRLDLPSDYVLCIGTLAARKNLLPTTHALSIAGTNVVVVGAAGKSQVFGAASGLSEAPANLLVAGRLSDAEVCWLIDNATALVFPSLYEGFGLPVVEAQGRGCPVICADRSSLPEITQGSALMFDPDHPEAVARLVAELQNIPGMRETVIESGLENVKRYTWARTAQIITGVIAG